MRGPFAQIERRLLGPEVVYSAEGGVFAVCEVNGILLLEAQPSVGCPANVSGETIQVSKKTQSDGSNG
jgi:hypothetical protein